MSIHLHVSKFYSPILKHRNYFVLALNQISIYDYNSTIYPTISQKTIFENRIIQYYIVSTMFAINDRNGEEEKIVSLDFIMSVSKPIWKRNIEIIPLMQYFIFDDRFWNSRNY